MKFKNKFLEDTAGALMAKAGLKKAPHNKSMHYFFDGVLRGGPCYFTMQHDPVEAESWFWLHPCRTDENKGERHHIRYNLAAYFNEDSPWSKVIKVFDTEMFEGYETPLEKAKLVAQIGWVLGPKVLGGLSPVQVGLFSVFTRRGFEFSGVRRAFKLFSTDPRTSHLPLNWNVFVANHILVQPGGEYKTQLSGWHNWCDVAGQPKTALGYMTKKVVPVGFDKSRVALKTGYWVGGNLDKYFPTLYKGKGPKDWAPPASHDTSGWDTKVLIKDAVEYNLKMYKELVKPYV